MYYLAYGTDIGSNVLKVCPSASIVKKDVLIDYRIVFRILESKQLIYLEKRAGSYTPCVLYEITQQEAEKLNKKHKLGELYDINFMQVLLPNKCKIPVFYYTLRGGLNLRKCTPSKKYFSSLEKGYTEMRFDVNILYNSIGA